MKSDKEIIAEALAGSQEAYSLLMNKYRQRIYRFIRRRTVDDAQAEEITQDVFVDAFKGLKAFKGDSQLYTWLCTIAYRKAAKQPKNSLKTDVEMVSYVTPEAILSEKQEVSRVSQICDELPLRQNRALLLKEYEGLSYMEIGAILGVSPMYAKKLVWKAKNTIREKMNDKR